MHNYSMLLFVFNIVSLQMSMSLSEQTWNPFWVVDHHNFGFVLNCEPLIYHLFLNFSIASEPKSSKEQNSS